MQQTAPVLLGEYRATIEKRGEAAVRSSETLMASDSRDELFYIPFEWTNRQARLVIVGISPGSNQLQLAYRAASSKIKVGLTDEAVLKAAKVHGAFGSPTMRPNLIKMLDHFDFPQLLGIEKSEDLWGRHADIFMGTSVVPHAAFRNGKPFAQSFDDVLKSPIFKESFERDFVSSLADIPSTAKFVALGRTPLDALTWCARNGHIDSDQVMGAFAHPSTNGGSAVDAYLGLRSNFNDKDPVLKSLDRLRMFYQGMSKNTQAARETNALAFEASVP